MTKLQVYRLRKIRDLRICRDLFLNAAANYDIYLIELFITRPLNVDKS